MLRTNHAQRTESPGHETDRQELELGRGVKTAHYATHQILVAYGAGEASKRASRDFDLTPQMISFLKRGRKDAINIPSSNRAW